MYESDAELRRTCALLLLRLLSGDKKAWNNGLVELRYAKVSYQEKKTVKFVWMVSTTVWMYKVWPNKFIDVTVVQGDAQTLVGYFEPLIGEGLFTVIACRYVYGVFSELERYPRVCFCKYLCCIILVLVRVSQHRKCLRWKVRVHLNIPKKLAFRTKFKRITAV